MRFNTLQIHSGQPNDAQTGAVTFPIYQTSTYAQDFPGEPTEYHGRKLNYGRTENPTRAAMETAVASLEGSEFGLAFPSGLAAIATVMNTLKAGDHLIVAADCYGGTYRMFSKVYAKFGLDFEFVDTTNLDNIHAALKPNTRMLWLETPSNPLINITDIAGASQLVKAFNPAISVLVDNTFATPYLQRPLALGADVVLHSVTKFLNGHADVLSGALVTKTRADWDAYKYIQNACGFIPGPQDCYLVLRGLKTLSLRMDRHCQNATRLAAWLEGRREVAKVYYPGLKTHPGHDVAASQMDQFGPMLAFELDADVEWSKKFLAALKLITLAESLGSVKTLICHPPTMTHASMEPEVRRRAGIADGLIRLAVGLEDVEDLIEDVEHALKVIR